jgi:ribonuclease-3
MDGKEPEIPTYKVTEVMGPTNTRVYKVAVYFKNKRLATSRGHSIQEAEMNAASNALVKRDYLFPQLKHQKRLLEKTTKKISQSQLFDKQGPK